MLQIIHFQCEVIISQLIRKVDFVELNQVYRTIFRLRDYALFRLNPLQP